jgi:hypothetical protein
VGIFLNSSESKKASVGKLPDTDLEGVFSGLGLTETLGFVKMFVGLGGFKGVTVLSIGFF